MGLAPSKNKKDNTHRRNKTMRRLVFTPLTGQMDTLASKLVTARGVTRAVNTFCKNWDCKIVWTGASSYIVEDSRGRRIHIASDYVHTV